MVDQVTGKVRLPAAMFEPRLPQTRPNAKQTDKYLSVNICSSLEAAGLPRDWRGNSLDFYSAMLSVSECERLALHATWEPVENAPNPEDDNPHHGGIQGVVEMFYADNDGYERLLTALAKAAEVLPECLPPTG